MHVIWYLFLRIMSVTVDSEISEIRDYELNAPRGSLDNFSIKVAVVETYQDSLIV